LSERTFKLSLNNQDLAEAFFEETRLLGIVSTLKDYQFCWQLNNLLGMDFRVNHDIEIKLNKTQELFLLRIPVSTTAGITESLFI